MRKIILATITISLFLNFSLSAKEVPSSGEMISELLVRPLGLAGLAVGTSLFIVTLPFGVLNRVSTGSWESVLGFWVDGDGGDCSHAASVIIPIIWKKLN